jgi:hypothetical protein
MGPRPHQQGDVLPADPRLVEQFEEGWQDPDSPLYGTGRVMSDVVMQTVS